MYCANVGSQFRIAQIGIRCDLEKRNKRVTGEEERKMDFDVLRMREFAKGFEGGSEIVCNQC